MEFLYSLFALLFVYVLQGVLAIRFARRWSHWSRRKLAFVSALVIPLLSMIAESIPFFVMWFQQDESHENLVDDTKIGLIVLGIGLPIIWLLGVAVSWSMLAWKKLPVPLSDLTKTFE